MDIYAKRSNIWYGGSRLMTNCAKNFGSVITWARDMIFFTNKSVICYVPDSPTYVVQDFTHQN